MISVEEALSRVLALSAPLGEESVPLLRAAGRTLSRPVAARMTQPPFAASAMDGFAICDVDHHPGRTLRQIGEAGAGHAFRGRVVPGQTVRIFTGAPLPAGAGRVVLQEDCATEGDLVTLGERLEQATHVRPEGQDFCLGDVFPAPRRLCPNDLALLAAMNIPEVPVFRRPVVALLATGDELVMPGEAPAEDQIIASNAFGLAPLIEGMGGEARILPIARDTEASLRFAFDLAQGADVIVTIGGASVGTHDLVGKVAMDLGLERAFWKISMRPGKPLMAGRMQGAVMLGLPGNPVSAIVCAHLFLAPLLAHLQGLPGAPAARHARLGAAVEANGARTHYMRATITEGGDGAVITPFDRQDSALLSILSRANALLIRPVGDVARDIGYPVTYIPI